MFNISEYLEKFKTVGQGERRVKEAISASVKEVLGLDLDKKNILVRNGEVTFKATPAVKNAIFIKKEAILSKMKGKNVEHVDDIR